MKKFAMMYNRIPFCGKWSIKEFAVDVISSTSPEKLMSNLVRFYMLMVIFIPSHLIQGLGGVRLITGQVNLFVSAYGLLYSAANFCAVIVQTYTTLRITRFAFWRWTPAKYKHEYDAPLKEEKISILFTLVGQMIYIALSAVCI